MCPPQGPKLKEKYPVVRPSQAGRAAAEGGGGEQGSGQQQENSAPVGRGRGAQNCRVWHPSGASSFCAIAGPQFLGGCGLGNEEGQKTSKIGVGVHPEVRDFGPGRPVADLLLK